MEKTQELLTSLSKRLSEKTERKVAYSYDGKNAILFERVGEEEVAFAKIRCAPECGIWNLYHKDEDGKWVAYHSLWYSKTIEKSLEEIENDPHQCFLVGG